MTSISVVMVTYHTGPVLHYAIERVLAEPGIKELVLVNNGNPSATLTRLQILASKHEKVTLISGQGNIGFAEGCNRGAQSVSGDFLVLLNPDCLIEPGSLGIMCDALKTTDEAMLAGPLLLNPDASEQRGCRRQLLTPKIALSECFRLDRFTKMQRLNDHEYDTPSEITTVPAISGACMCIRSQDYHALDGLDEKFFLHVEDLDFCARILETGCKTIFVPQARVVHLLSTSQTTSFFLEKYKARGFIRYFRKHFDRDYPRWQHDFAAIGIYLRMLLKTLQAEFTRNAPLKPAAIAGKKILLLLGALKQKGMGSALEGKHVCVTGATSPLGMILCGRLLAAGAEVHAVSRSGNFPLHLKNLHWMTANMTLPKFTPPREIEVLFHCAPLWVLPHTLEKFQAAGVKRVIAFGSTSVFSKKGSGNNRERMTAQKLRQAEELIAKKCPLISMRYTVLRPTLIYGTGLDGNVSRIARFIRRCHFFPIVPPGRGLRQPVHADDLAQAAMQSYANEESEDTMYNVSGGETLSYRDMVLRVFHTMKKKPILMPLVLLPPLLELMGKLYKKSGVNAEMANRMNEDLVFSHEPAELDFGYHPRGFLKSGKADLTGDFFT